LAAFAYGKSQENFLTFYAEVVPLARKSLLKGKNQYG
jgi:hypothetical protein